jgi:transmembrane sensor
MHSSITYENLFRYFSGHASSFQKKQIEEWVREDGNLEHFYYALASWEKQNLQYTADLSEALTRHHERMEQAPAQPTPPATHKVLHRLTSLGRWWVAASAALLLLTGWLYQTHWQYQTFATDYGQTLSFTLADGSQVDLNANSILRVPRFGFDDATRTVYLEGEAAFDVRHTQNHQPFIVKTPKSLDVIVLGTKFTVFSRSRATRVALNSGKVQLLAYANREKPVQKVMKPGELATLDAEGKIEIRAIETSEDPVAWKDHRFVFTSTPLSEIALMLEETFGVQVLIPEQQVARMTVSGSFTAHSAEELVQTLSEASTLTYQKEKRKIILQSR